MKEYFKFPNRDLVNSNSWEKLMTLLQCDDYHCIFTNQRYNPKTNSFELNPDALPFEYTEDGGIVIKNNKVSSVSNIQKNDKLKVMTETLPDKIASGMSIDARIIFVEN